MSCSGISSKNLGGYHPNDEVLRDNRGKRIQCIVVASLLTSLKSVGHLTFACMVIPATLIGVSIQTVRTCYEKVFCRGKDLPQRAPILEGYLKQNRIVFTVQLEKAVSVKKSYVSIVRYLSCHRLIRKRMESEYKS